MIITISYYASFSLAVLAHIFTAIDYAKTHSFRLNIIVCFMVSALVGLCSYLKKNGESK
jgi:hypothetical protein